MLIPYDQFWYGNLWTRDMFDRVKHDPYPKAVGVQHPKLWVPPTCAHTVRQTATKFLQLSKQMTGNFLQARPPCRPGQKFSVTQMLTCDQFVIANHHVEI